MVKCEDCESYARGRCFNVNVWDRVPAKAEPICFAGSFGCIFAKRIKPKRADRGDKKT